MDTFDAAFGDAPGENTAAPADTSAAVETATPAEGAAGPARGPDGKFTSPAAPQATEQAPSEAAAPPVQTGQDSGQPAPGYVPLAALMDVRDEAKELKRKLAEYESQQQQQEPQGPPSIFDDEGGFIDHFGNHISNAVLNVRLDISEDNAREKHGDAVVDAVQGWFKEKGDRSPEYRREVLSQRNPYAYAIAAMQREQALAKVDPADVDNYLAWKAAQAAGQANVAQTQPAAASAAPPRPAAPTRSLASASSAGGVQHIPTGPGAAFDAAFPK